MISLPKITISNVNEDKLLALPAILVEWKRHITPAHLMIFTFAEKCAKGIF